MAQRDVDHHQPERSHAPQHLEQQHAQKHAAGANDAMQMEVNKQREHSPRQQANEMGARSNSPHGGDRFKSTADHHLPPLELTKSDKDARKTEKGNHPHPDAGKIAPERPYSHKAPEPQPDAGTKGQEVTEAGPTGPKGSNPWAGSAIKQNPDGSRNLKGDDGKGHTWDVKVDEHGKPIGGYDHIKNPDNSSEDREYKPHSYSIEKRSGKDGSLTYRKDETTDPSFHAHEYMKHEDGSSETWEQDDKGTSIRRWNKDKTSDYSEYDREGNPLSYQKWDENGKLFMKSR